MGGPQASVEVRGVRNGGWWTFGVPRMVTRQAGPGFWGLEQRASLLGWASVAAPQRAVWWGRDVH